MTDRIISIDAESNGLGGRAFAVALTLSGPAGEQDHAVFRCPIGEAEVDSWVAEHVLPTIIAVPVTHWLYQEMLADVRNVIVSWGGKPVPLIAHVAWPVEARLLLDVYPGNGVWDGPYPLIDVASVLLAKGHDPLSVDDYLAAHGIPAPEGSPHHPLYDARAAALAYWHLMTPEATP